MSKSIVYFTKDTSPEAFVKIYNALGIELKGKVAVKMSMGEPGGHNYLKPDQIKPIMDRVKGTIIECSTAYGGKRDTPDLYDKVACDHGFKPMYEVDIMDKDGEIYLPLYNGKHLEYQIAGKNFDNYDSMLVLSHFKGHAMGGFFSLVPSTSTPLSYCIYSDIKVFIFLTYSVKYGLRYSRKSGSQT